MCLRILDDSVVSLLKKTLFHLNLEYLSKTINIVLVMIRYAIIIYTFALASRLTLWRPMIVVQCLYSLC